MLVGDPEVLGLLAFLYLAARVTIYGIEANVVRAERLWPRSLTGKNLTVADRASYSESTRPSAGIRHVLVNGEFVVRDGDIVPDARPGRPVRAEPR